MKVVVSLGNSALSDPNLHLTSGDLFQGIHNAAVSVHTLLDAGHSVVLTFGHEHALDADPLRTLQTHIPQVGNFKHQEVQRQGLIGYFLEQALRNSSNGKRQFATIMTHVLVDRNDPAFATPRGESSGVCIGDEVDEATALGWEKHRRWTMKLCSNGYRRIVPSPTPICVLQSQAIKHLVSAQCFTVLCSGSGVAVTRDLQNRETGVEALVDKDRAAAVLAHDIDADALLLLTDVLGVYENWKTQDRKLLSEIRINDRDMESMCDTGMRPKLEAAAWFADFDKIAAIGPIGNALDVLNGTVGTRVLSKPK